MFSSLPRALVYSNKFFTSQHGKILFIRKQSPNMFNVKIHLDLYVYTYFLRKFRSVQEYVIEI